MAIDPTLEEEQKRHALLDTQRPEVVNVQVRSLSDLMGQPRNSFFATNLGQGKPEQSERQQIAEGVADVLEKRQEITQSLATVSHSGQEQLVLQKPQKLELPPVDHMQSLLLSGTLLGRYLVDKLAPTKEQNQENQVPKQAQQAQDALQEDHQKTQTALLEEMERQEQERKRKLAQSM